MSHSYVQKYSDEKYPKGVWTQLLYGMLWRWRRLSLRWQGYTYLFFTSRSTTLSQQAEQSMTLRQIYGGTHTHAHTHTIHLLQVVASLTPWMLQQFRQIRFVHNTVQTHFFSFESWLYLDIHIHTYIPTYTNILYIRYIHTYTPKLFTGRSALNRQYCNTCFSLSDDACTLSKKYWTKSCCNYSFAVVGSWFKFQLR